MRRRIIDDENFRKQMNNGATSWTQDKENAPETQDFPTISELFVAAAPRLGVLASNASYAHNRQARAPDKDEGEGEDESDFRGDVFLR